MASELLDLEFKKHHNFQGCLFNAAAYARPVSTLSSTDASARIQEDMELDLDAYDSLMEASEFMSGTALYNEKELRYDVILSVKRVIINHV